MGLIAHPQLMWKNLEPEFRHLIAEVAHRLNVNSFLLTSHLHFCLQTIKNDISWGLLDIPENHFKKQLLPEVKHCWVSSEGVRLQVRGKSLIIGKVSTNFEGCNNLEDYFYSIQAHRTQMRQITTYNTIVPFAVIDYCYLSLECPPMILHHLSHKELNFRLPSKYFEVLRREAKNAVKEYILRNTQRKAGFYEFCGQYIPSITYKERISNLYPDILKMMTLESGNTVKVLDVGCAPKIEYGAPSLIDFIEYLYINGYHCDCLGIDREFPIGFTKWNSEYKGSKIRYYQHDIRNKLPTNEKYDVIFCCNVINWYDSIPEIKKNILDNLILALNFDGLLIIDESNYYLVYQNKSSGLEYLLKRERNSVELY